MYVKYEQSLDTSLQCNTSDFNIDNKTGITFNQQYKPDKESGLGAFFKIIGVDKSIKDEKSTPKKRKSAILPPIFFNKTND